LGERWPDPGRPGGVDQLIYQESDLSRAAEGTLSLMLLR
jgi:hypothetical protein